MKNLTDNNNAAKIVAYYRVSTKKQGLSMKEQSAEIHEYAQSIGAEIVKEIEEKESGEECARPGLNLAIATARKHRATLAVARADRLTRDLSYAAHLFFKSGLTIKALDMSEEAVNNPIVFGVVFGEAQHYLANNRDKTNMGLNAVRRNIAEQGYHISKRSKRTITKLGRPNAEITPEMRAAAATARRDAANTNPANLAAAEELRRYFAGVTKRNLSAAARHLNDKQLYTPRGVFHDARSVKLLIARYNI